MAGSTLGSARPTGSRSGRAVLRILRTPSGAIGTILLAVLITAAFGASWATPYDPSAQDLGATTRPPSLTPIRGNLHLLGTDQLGRDILSRLLVGLRISLLVALVVVPVFYLAIENAKGPLSRTLKRIWG